MKWEIKPTNVSNLVEYHLIDNDQPKLTLKYNTLQHSVRVDSNDTRRLFFLHQHPGILRSRTVFTNEYGVEVGRISADVWSGGHYAIELGGKKYHIGLRNNPLAELVVYEKNIRNPLATCGVMIDNGTPGFSFDAEDNEEVSSLLLALCWYLFLPVAGVNVREKDLSA